MHLICAVLVSAVSISCAAQAAIGPSPYPASKALWPGQGVVRVFSWMSQNRASFWARRDQDHGAMVFAGDSLTGQWKTLAKDFPALKVANRGIGGEVSRGLLFRFQEDVLDLAPSSLVILIGTNDLSARQRAADTAGNLAAMLAQLDARYPGTPVILCTVPPRLSASAPADPQQLMQLNADIKDLAAKRPHTQVIDLHALLSDADGRAQAPYFRPDGIHLTPDGYAVWRRAVQAALDQDRAP